MAEEILNYARQHNVSRIVRQAASRLACSARWRGLAADANGGSGPAGRLGDERVDRGGDEPPEPPAFHPTSPASAYLGALGVTLVTTLVCVPPIGISGLPNLAMIYLVGVVVSAVRWGAASSLCALLSVAALDFSYRPGSRSPSRMVSTSSPSSSCWPWGSPRSARRRARNQARLACQRERGTRERCTR